MATDASAPTTPVGSDGGSGTSAAAAAAAGVTPSTQLVEAAKKAGHDILGSIAELRRQQAELRAQRKKVAKKLKNEEKRRSRLRRRAWQLSDSDLAALLRMRSEEKPDEPPQTASA